MERPGPSNAPMNNEEDLRVMYSGGEEPVELLYPPVGLAGKYRGIVDAFYEIKEDLKSMEKIWVAKLKRLHTRMLNTIRSAQIEVHCMVDDGLLCQETYEDMMEKLNERLKSLKDLNDKLDGFESQRTNGVP